MDKPAKKTKPAESAIVSADTPKAAADTQAPKWQLTWSGKTWSEDDLTGAHLAVLVLIHGQDDWGVVSPTAGPVRLMAVLATFIAISDGRDVTEVNAELSRASASALLDALTMV